MTRDRRNNLITTLTVLVVLLVSGTTFLLVKSNEPPKKLAGHQIGFAVDSGRNHQFGIDKFTHLRNYKVFRLTADSSSNLEVLEKARKELNSIKDSHDTLNGVHIVIADNTPYRFYIKSIDICSEKKPRAFAPHKNDIYAWYVYVPLKDKRQEKYSDK